MNSRIVFFLIVPLIWVCLFVLPVAAIHADDQYTGNLKNVLGDVKQGQIQNKLDTTKKIDNVLEGFKLLGCNGVRITLFPEGTNPNPDMFDYLYKQARKHGFKIFANPAQHAGGQRVASRSVDPGPVKNDMAVTRVLIKRVQKFAKRYPCDWINPFNEDGIDGSAFTGQQMQFVYENLYKKVGDAELIGPCTWGIPSAIKILKKTTIENYIAVATTHNLGHNHESWREFVRLARSQGLPVWDSEVNKHKKFEDKPHRLTAALAAEVDGLVLYDAWKSFVNINNGKLNKNGKNVRNLILKEFNQNVAAKTEPEKYAPVEGDILFHYTPGNKILNAIADAGDEMFSHCGILVKKGDKWFVLEAVKTVTETPIKKWRSRGRNKLMHVYRLNEPLRKHIPKTIGEAQKFLGRPHDFNCKLSDSHIYGAELVYKSFKNATGKELGSPVVLRKLDWKRAHDAILSVEKSVPLKRKIITAEIIRNSSDLTQVYSSDE